MNNPHDMLSLSDEELFQKGASHVFAIIFLAKLKKNDGFQLGRVEIWPPISLGDRACHVYVGRGNEAFDVDGTHYRDAFLETWKRKAALGIADRFKAIEHASLVETSVSDLLKESETKETKPYPKSQWDLHLDRHFLICSASRAASYITQNRGKWPSALLD
jgi:hypothetical protein